MADQLATFRQQRFSRLLALCAVGKFPDAVYETCAPNVSPVRLVPLPNTFYEYVANQLGPHFADSSCYNS